ncbi:hypothetical protein Tco_0717218 [Tanacetum coccineum]
MSTANQQTLVESGALDRPLILEKGSYVPWASRFLRFVDDKREEGELMRHSIDDGESLTFVYKRFATLINIMDRNGVIPQEIFINTKLLNSLQPEWSKYVTMTRQKYVLKEAHYDQLYNHLSQFEPHVNASKANKVARNHDPLALVATSHAYFSHSHASPSYSHSSQPYYVTHPSLVIDYEDDYQGEIQVDAQEDKLTTTMILLARAITQRYSTPTNNRLRTSSNTRNQAVIQDVHLDEEEKDCMLDNAYGDNTLEELSAIVIMMARIQPDDDKYDAEPKYDAKVISEVNALQINLINGLLSKGVHEHKNHEKLKTVIHTSVDDQINSDIIFDDPYEEDNGGQLG